MKKLLIAIAFVVCLSGCDFNFNLLQSAGDKVNENSEVASTVGSSAIDAIEEITGKDIVTKDTAAKGEEISNTVGDVAGKVKTGTDIVKNFLPEDKQIYADGVGYAAYLAAALASVAAGVFKKQKDKAEIVTASVIAGANGLSGAGKAIVSQAKKDGVSNEVEKAYLSAVKAGNIEIS